MKSPNIRLFSTDLDGTLLGSPEATWRFTRAWQSLNSGRRPLLVYNTGRTIMDTRALTEARDLPEPDFIIGSVGTELYDSLYNRADDFRLQFGEGWDLERVREIVAAIPGVKEQPFYSALRRVAAMPKPQVRKPADVTELPRPTPTVPDLPQAA